MSARFHCLGCPLPNGTAIALAAAAHRIVRILILILLHSGTLEVCHMSRSLSHAGRARAVVAMLVSGASVFWSGASLMAQTPQPVQWANLVNATATGDTILKSAGCDTCADAGGTGTVAVSSIDGFVEFTPGWGARLYAGLGSTVTADTNPALIDYAFSFWPDGGWDVRERNVYKTEGHFVDGDVFRIAIVSGTVIYYRNGTAVYSSATAPTAPLVPDTTLIGTGSIVHSAIVTAQQPSPSPAPGPVAILTASLPGGALLQPYSVVLQASGGTGNFAWNVAAGSLPPGLSLSAGGTVAGVPSSTGLFSFTLRATDTGSPGNYASQPLTIAISGSAASLAISTRTLESTHMGDPYSALLRATGGSGLYRWTIAAGALAPGLTLDPASGGIQGTTTASGRFNVTVRATDTIDSVSVDQPLTLNVLAAAPPSVYGAITDRVTRVKPALPALGKSGYIFADPTFGARMMRVTDGGVRPGLPGRSYRTPSSTHLNAWSADGRYFYTVSTDGTVVPFSFDRTTMTAARLQPSTTGDGGLTLRFFNEPMFSYVTPGIAYGTYNGPGSNLRSVDAFDFETGQYMTLLNLDTLAPNLAGTYTGGLGASAGPVEKIFAFFGGTSQDRHFYLVVFDKDDPARRHLLDTSASTLDGQPTNIPLNFRIHAAAIDRSGQYVTIYPTGVDLQAPRLAAPAYVWDTVSNTFTATPLVESRSGGHDTYGFGYRVNQDCCTTTTWDAAQWQFRSLASPLVTFDLITPILLPKEIYLADHPSWHNAQPDRFVPFIEANYRYGANTTPWRAWDEEITAVQTDAAGSGALVWRFAHHRSAVADDLDPSRISFWYTPRVNVSPDGRWALFTSNWEKTLGTDPGGEPGGTARQDVFLVELSGGAAAAGPVAIATPDAPGGVVGTMYTLGLSATGGSGVYQWGLAAGALPAGLTLNTSTGVISGTPSAAGAWSVTIRAADATDSTNTALRAFSIVIAAAQVTPAVAITTTTVPGAVRGVAYSVAIATTGGRAPFAWSIASGSLPDGLTLNPSTGVVAGTPKDTGVWNVTVRVADSGTPETTDTQALSIHVRKR